MLLVAVTYAFTKPRGTDSFLMQLVGLMECGPFQILHMEPSATLHTSSFFPYPWGSPSTRIGGHRAGKNHKREGAWVEESRPGEWPDWEHGLDFYRSKNTIFVCVKLLNS